jgi:major capsid protein E
VGSAAGTAFRNSEQVEKSYDKRFINYGKIEPRFLGNGAQYIGDYMGMQIIIDEGSYFNEATGASTPFFDPKKVLVGASVNAGNPSRFAYTGSTGRGQSSRLSRFPRIFGALSPTI